MPKAVFSTVAPFGYEIDVDRFLASFRALGCTSCQYVRNPLKPASVAEALAASARAGMPFDSIHGLFGPELDPSSPDAAVRARALRVYEDEARLALDLGGPMVVVHPCRSNSQKVEPPPPPMPIEEARRQQHERWPHLHDFLRRLAEVGERMAVTFLIENLMYDCPLGHDPAQLAERVMAVKSPRIRMCFDTGHAHVTLSRISPAGRGAVALALKVCAPAIGYFHFHDNNSVRDSHLMPGRGGPDGIDWEVVRESLRATEAPAVRMLEVFEDPTLSGPPEALGPRLREWLGLVTRGQQPLK